jgi:hypothetical protein
VNRIGELSKTSLKMNLLESATKSSQIIEEVQRCRWGICPEPLPTSFDVISKQIPKGAECRILFSQQ